MFSWFLRVIRRALSSWLTRGQPVQLGLRDIAMPARESPPPSRGSDQSPGDPTRRVRHPKPHRPYEGSGAIALVEPEEPQLVAAVARHRVSGLHKTGAPK